jgi:hypothetical protein
LLSRRDVGSDDRAAWKLAYEAGQAYEDTQPEGQQPMEGFILVYLHKKKVILQDRCGTGRTKIENNSNNKTKQINN